MLINDCVLRAVVVIGQVEDKASSSSGGFTGRLATLHCHLSNVLPNLPTLNQPQHTPLLVTDEVGHDEDGVTIRSLDVGRLRVWYHGIIQERGEGVEGEVVGVVAALSRVVRERCNKHLRVCACVCVCGVGWGWALGYASDLSALGVCLTPTNTTDRPTW